MLHSLGTALIGGSNALNSANVIPNNGYVIEPGSPGVIARCVTGEPPGTAGINSFLGGWFRDGSQLPVDQSCSSGAPVETRGSSVSEGYIGSNDLYRCGSSFTTSEEGVYECMTVAGGSVNTQTLTLNVYASSRSEFSLLLIHRFQPACLFLSISNNRHSITISH